ncbi:protein-disulfide reductase DsbD family protein [Enterovirga rhinocerotis]|uniref:Thiol:disulfide interchange protein DsbD n=1 Tax=Enterovirga rhinocerotis TaxID=1339210 RepID=A0A4R7C877_9HYPH|nr:protein-disulfide reductase DsbD domain-containing protein [Enterovirga rhinocerotis]TDR94820.1 thiol:disulfide interchange protein DsbD [Enterovirga rhinocerotis]
MRAFLGAILGALCLSLLSPASQAAPKASDLVQAELLTESRAIEPGKPFTVGVRLRMAEHWHTYWRNPGDSGLATEIDWTLPPGFEAGPIQWPTPSRIPVSHLVNYGYEDETTLLVEVTPPADLAPGKSVSMKALVRYLVCERECIPGEADLSATVPTAAAGQGGGAEPTSAYIFTAARASLPKPSPWKTSVSGEGERITLSVEAPGLKPDGIASAYFFPAGETALDHAAPQALTMRPDGFSLGLQRSNVASGPIPTELPGVLVIEEKLDGGTARQSFQIGTAPEPAKGSGAGALPPAATNAPPVDLGFGSVAWAAFFAFLGGLVLNLMPCVFPVLSIKVLSLVRHSGEGAASIRLAGLAYTAGVVVSFLALAGLLLAVRAGGAEIGWGFQLQSPALVVGLIFLLAAVGLSLSGVVEFGTGIAGRVGTLTTGSGASGSFLTGVLAALVATPCTAPFMGAAVGYALTAPPVVALSVFAALGLGLAAPFLVLTLWPALLARLPRPGPWMDTLKQVLAFPVYATVAWLLFVLAQQVGPGALFSTLLGLVLLGFGLWCWRLAAMRDGWGRRIGQSAAVASLAGLLAIGWSVAQERPPAAGQAAASQDGTEPFTQARLDQLRAEGRPVFVNMTAAWCITCLVNERTVLSTAAVKAKLGETGTVYLKGDWTNQNPEITRLLERHGRSGVPLYVLYPGQGEPVVLPQILTSSMVVDSLSALPAGVRRAEASIPSPAN